MRGSHGTCEANAKSIEKEGKFKASGRKGKLGSGVYFWEYQTDKNLARKLAQAWHQQALNEGKFRDIQKDGKKCAIVFVDFRHPRNELRLTNDDVLVSFEEFFLTIVKTLGHIDRQEQCNICDDFVDRMEKICGKTYDIIAGMVHLPMRNLDENHIARVFDTWPCVVVKNTDVIEINEVEYE